MNTYPKTHLPSVRSTPAVIVAFALAALVLSLPGNAETPDRGQRPAAWAVPIEKEGLPNLFKVSDTLYRGAQPTRQGLLELKKMGIKTVVNLRSWHSDADRIQGTGLLYFQIPMTASGPKKASFDRFLEIVQNPELQPVFVHCMRGADRTGGVVALYRMEAQGWSADEAIDELKDGGYRFNPRYREIIELVRSYEKPWLPFQERNARRTDHAQDPDIEQRGM